MALLITLDNVYTLYNIDPSMKTEGIVILQQRHDPSQQYSSHHRLFDGILIGFMLEGAMKSQIHFLEYEVNKGDIAILPPQKSMVKNRTHELIDDFYQLLSKHALKERSVVFYAEKLNLTAQYLSTFLKQKTGKGVLQWIDHITILHAKTLLKSTHLSIKEISNELHFEETSIFCRYFKRVVGISPKTYRSK